MIRYSKVFALLLLASVGQAAAFPTWMGVYGQFKRHDDPANPGEFMIMMNQDYSGLQASVGIQVDGGAWTEHPMTYMANADGNSLWRYVPAQAFPGGATVKYYFHGFEGSSRHIYDSLNGSNYVFEVPQSQSVNWDRGTVCPTMADIAGDGDTIYGVMYDGTTLQAVKRSAAGTNWTYKTVTVAPSIFSVRIAANNGQVVIQYNEAGTIKVCRSSDGGATFSEPVVIPSAANIVALEPGRMGHFHLLAVDTTSNWALQLRSSTNGGASWSAPQFVTAVTNSMFGSITARLGASDSGSLTVAFTHDETDGRMFGTGRFIVARSTDGETWSVQQLSGYDITRGNTATPCLLVAADGIPYAGLSKTEGAFPNNGPAKVWRFISGQWTSATLPLSASSNRSFLLEAPNAEIVYIDGGAYGTQQKAWVSTDDGATFSSSSDIPMVNVVSNFGFSPISRAISTDAGLHLLWVGFDMGSSTSPEALQTGTIAAQPVTWVGDTFHWPTNGALKAGDSLWVNTASLPKGAGRQAIVVYSTNRVTWSVAQLVPDDIVSTKDLWHQNIGAFRAGSTVEYAVAVIDGTGNYVWDSRNGQNYRAIVKAAPSVQWIGNTYNYPANGQVTPATTLWVNTETWPKGAGVSGTIVYQVNGGAWTTKALSKAGVAGNNDWWNVSLGKFAAGSTIRYAVSVTDGNGVTKWDNNGGQDYRVAVN